MHRRRFGSLLVQWRIHRRSLVFWIVTLVLALVSAQVVNRAVRSTGSSRWGPVTQVLVVTRNVPPGRVLVAADVKLAQVPVVFVRGGGVRSVVAAVGRSVRIRMRAGAALDPGSLTPAPVGGLAARTGPGRVSVAVPISGSALRLSPGDRVDVLATADGSGDTEVAVLGAEVVEVRATVVTVALPAGDAVRLASVLAERTVTLALRGG